MSTPATTIPGLTFRHATAADWDGMADVLNRASRADDIDEVRTAPNFAAESPGVGQVPHRAGRADRGARRDARRVLRSATGWSATTR